MEILFLLTLLNYLSFIFMVDFKLLSICSGCQNAVETYPCRWGTDLSDFPNCILCTFHQTHFPLRDTVNFKCTSFDVSNSPIKHFWFFVLWNPKKSLKSWKSLYFLYSYHLTDKCNRKIISPQLFFLNFTYKYVNFM